MTGTPEQESTASQQPAHPAAAGIVLSEVRLGFGKDLHLRKRADFERVYAQGRRHFSQNLTVFFRRREAADPVPYGAEPGRTGTRVGFTVGRVLGGAVERNRMKRRMREAVRQELAWLTTPVDVVIHPKRSVLKVDFAVLRQEMAAAFTAVESGKGAPPQPRERKFGKAAKGKMSRKSPGKTGPR